MSDPKWRDQAACTQTDSRLWDTDYPSGNRAAAAICKTCPVLNMCHQEATTQDVQWGVWAGIDRRPGKAKRLERTPQEEARVERKAQRASAIYRARRDEFIAQAETAIATGVTAAEFCTEQGIKPDSLRTRLRRADRMDLMTQWPDHTPTSQDDTPEIITGRRNALEHA